MQFHIRHVTTYRYDRPVVPGTHRVRLRPRAGDSLRLDAFQLQVHPRPVEVTSGPDADGNTVESLVFEGRTQEIRIAATSRCETLGPPAFAPGAAPVTPSVPSETPPDGMLREFHRSLSVAAEQDPQGFLRALSERMHADLEHVSRPTGLPFPPEILLRQGKGACRDFAVLFVECCRMEGIPARFVSGYLPADPGEGQHMHAWAEALLPGAGWIPFDPTRASPPGAEYVPVAAATDPAAAAPIEGVFTGFARSVMSVELKVETD